MILAPRLRLLATNPAVLMVALAVVLYPFVREEKPSRVLRLSVEQVDRALHDERGRSDAPETAERRNSTLERALDEEALAEHALLRELHRHDDGLRLALAEAAKRDLFQGMVAVSPTDDELRALESAAPVVMERLVDVDVERLGLPAGRDASERLEGLVVGDVEARLGVAHLPLPDEDARTVDATANGGERLRLTLHTHLETPSERFARARPELVLRYRASMSRVQELTRIRALREGYDRVEIP